MKYIPIKDWSDREWTYNGKYVLIWCPEHPKNFGGYYYEHRLFMEAKIGRVLKEWETCHHINENRCDNTDENLFLCSRQEHDYAA